MDTIAVPIAILILAGLLLLCIGALIFAAYAVRLLCAAVWTAEEDDDDGPDGDLPIPTDPPSCPPHAKAKPASSSSTAPAVAASSHGGGATMPAVVPPLPSPPPSISPAPTSSAPASSLPSLQPGIPVMLYAGPLDGKALRIPEEGHRITVRVTATGQTHAYAWTGFLSRSTGARIYRHSPSLDLPCSSDPAA